MIGMTIPLGLLFNTLKAYQDLLIFTIDRYGDEFIFTEDFCLNRANEEVENGKITSI